MRDRRRAAVVDPAAPGWSDAEWDGAAGTDRLAALLEQIAAAVVAWGTLPFPNPMGLPAPSTDDA